MAARAVGGIARLARAVEPRLLVDQDRQSAQGPRGDGHPEQPPQIAAAVVFGHSEPGGADQKTRAAQGGQAAGKVSHIQGLRFGFVDSLDQPLVELRASPLHRSRPFLTV